MWNWSWNYWTSPSYQGLAAGIVFLTGHWLETAATAGPAARGEVEFKFRTVRLYVALLTVPARPAIQRPGRTVLSSSLVTAADTHWCLSHSTATATDNNRHTTCPACASCVRVYTSQQLAVKLKKTILHYTTEHNPALHQIRSDWVWSVKGWAEGDSNLACY